MDTAQYDRTAVLVLVAGLLACGGPAGVDAEATDDGAESSSSSEAGVRPSIPVDLVWPELWVEDAQADMFAGHAPSPVTCDFGFANEFGLFEIDTGLCNYAVFSQSSAAEVFAGDRIALVFTHDDLLAPTPAAAHIAVAIDEQVIWEIEVPIPGPYGIIDGEWIADRSIAAGSKLALHLHNHGYNSWRVISIKSGPP